MKGHLIIKISVVVLFVIIALLISVYPFSLRESELTDNSVNFIQSLNESEVSNLVICDSKSSNNCKAFIYRADFTNGDEKYYAVSYYKHILFPRYQRTFYSDYLVKDFSGLLISTGFPYETVYDISDYTLEYKDSILNYNLIIIMISVVTFFVLFSIFVIRRIKGSKKRERE